MAKSVFTKTKLSVYFVILFLVVLLSAGAAVGCYFYFGRNVESEGVKESFEDNLVLGRSFTVEELLRDQEYDYGWITSGTAKVSVYVKKTQSEEESYFLSDEILFYDEEKGTFTVRGVGEGYIDFRFVMDHSVGFVVPFETTFDKGDTEVILRENYPDFYLDGIVSYIEIDGVRSVRLATAGIYDVSELTVFPNLDTLVLASPDVIHCTGMEIAAEQMTVYVTDGVYDGYLADPAWETYAEKIYPIVNLEREMSTVVFEFNGGYMPVVGQEGPNYFVSVKKGEQADFAKYVILREGYTFEGWFTSDDNGLTLSDRPIPADYIFTEDIKLYAKWRLNHYAIVYHDPFIAELPDLIEGAYWETFTLSDRVFERVGYTFLGWSRRQGAATAEYTVGQKVANLTEIDQATVDLYGVWSANPYTLIYRDGEYESVVDTRYDRPVTIIGREPRIGFTFLGWSLEENADSATYRVGSPVDRLVSEYEGSIALYGVWKEHTYSVIYDANNASGDVETISGIGYDDDYTIDKQPSYAGYAFRGWATTAGAQEVTYAVGRVVSKLTDEEAGSIHLYAVWTRDPYTIVYDANGGTNAPASQINLIYASAVSLSTTKPIWAGHSFLGWATVADATEAQFAPGQEMQNILADGDGLFKLYAVWSTNTYTIVYDANGGSGAPLAQENVSYGESISLRSETPVRENYAFLGWVLIKGRTDGAFSAGAEVENLAQEGQVTLYAVWRAVSYRIEYDANGGNNPPEMQIATYGSGVTICGAGEMTREGFIFQNKWTATVNDKNEEYAAGQTVDIALYNGEDSVTLYAVWNPTLYTVVYDANGGDNPPPSQNNLKFDREYTLSSATPTREGYGFVKWSTMREKTEGATYYDPGATIKGITTPTYTLYALWEELLYKIAYDANGGTGAPLPQEELKYNQVYTLRQEEPTWEGRDFKGWATTPSAKEATYSANGSFRVKDNVTLYAVWKPVQFKVVYSDGGGSGAPLYTYFEYNASNCTVSSDMPTKTGYATKQWQVVGSNLKYNKGQKLTVNQVNELWKSIDKDRTVTLTPVWEAVDFDIRYDANKGSGAPAKMRPKYNTSVTISSTVPTKTDGYFKGWALSSDAANAKYTSGTTLSASQLNTLYAENVKDGVVTLYAVWEQMYQVTISSTGVTITGVTNGAYFRQDTKVTFHAKYASGYDSNFKVSYTINNQQTDKTENDKDYSFKMPAHNVTIYGSASEHGCVATGSKVLLADGTRKNIEDITGEETLLAWNLAEGRYEAVPLSLVLYHGEEDYTVTTLEFEDGTSVRTITSHGFFDVECNRFVFITAENCTEYVGHRFVKAVYTSPNEITYTFVELTNAYSAVERTGSYSLQTAFCENFIVEDLFSLTPAGCEGFYDCFEMGELLTYDREKMQQDIETYGVYDYEEWAEYLTYEQFMAFNGPWLKVGVEKGVILEEDIRELIAYYLAYLGE